MKARQKIKIMNHFDKFFGKKCQDVLHIDEMKDLNIDVLVYEPTKQYPFWKMATVGASDYKMTGKKVLSHYNEYMMFLDKFCPIRESEEEWKWFYNLLIEVARFPFETKEMLTYGHTIDMGESQEEMQGVFICFPEAIEDSRILRCKTGLGKTVACLQVMPITRPEMEDKLKNGIDTLNDLFYPSQGEQKCCAERNRTK